MASQMIRVFGDPVLRQRTQEVTEIDGKIAKLVADMFETMYEAPGLGLAANQVGIDKRLFVYDLAEGDDPRVLINPQISDYDGEWMYEEACLSVPGLRFPIMRPNHVHITGLDLDGNEVSFEADELMGRLFQHEMDHLDGKLLLEQLDDDTRKKAFKELRRRGLGPGALV